MDRFRELLLIKLSKNHYISSAKVHCSSKILLPQNRKPPVKRKGNQWVKCNLSKNKTLLEFKLNLSGYHIFKAINL